MDLVAEARFVSKTAQPRPHIDCSDVGGFSLVLLALSLISLERSPVSILSVRLTDDVLEEAHVSGHVRVERPRLPVPMKHEPIGVVKE